MEGDIYEAILLRRDLMESFVHVGAVAAPGGGKAHGEDIRACNLAALADHHGDAAAVLRADGNDAAAALLIRVGFCAAFDLFAAEGVAAAGHFRNPGVYDSYFVRALVRDDGEFEIAAFGAESDTGRFDGEDIRIETLGDSDGQGQSVSGNQQFRAAAFGLIRNLGDTDGKGAFPISRGGGDGAPAFIGAAGGPAAGSGDSHLLRAAGMVKLEAGSIHGKNGSLFFGLFFGLFLVLLGAGCKRCQGQNDCKIAERFHGALKYCPLQIYKNI